MKITTALILCAGFGKRLTPLTLKKPKPLLEIKNITMLENCINVNVKLGIKKTIEWFKDPKNLKNYKSNSYKI